MVCLVCWILVRPHILRIAFVLLLEFRFLICSRTPERDTHGYKEDVDEDLLAAIEEWRSLGAFLGTYNSFGT